VRHVNAIADLRLQEALGIIVIVLAEPAAVAAPEFEASGRPCGGEWRPACHRNNG
jgi:hypothetical protein